MQNLVDQKTNGDKLLHEIEAKLSNSGKNTSDIMKSEVEQLNIIL